MATAHVQNAALYNATFFATDGIGEISFSGAATVGNRVYVCFGIDATSRTVTSVTDDGGNTYALVNQGGTNATGEVPSNSEAWVYAADVANAATQITVTLNSAFAGDASVAIVEVTGQHVTTPDEDVTAAVTGAGETTHTFSDVTYSGGLLLAYMHGSGGAYTIDADFTTVQNVAKAVCGYDETVSGTFNCVNTSSGNESVVKILIAVQSAAAGAARVNPFVGKLGFPLVGKL